MPRYRIPLTAYFDEWIERQGTVATATSLERAIQTGTTLVFAELKRRRHATSVSIRVFHGGRVVGRVILNGAGRKV